MSEEKPDTIGSQHHSSPLKKSGGTTEKTKLALEQRKPQDKGSSPIGTITRRRLLSSSVGLLGTSIVGSPLLASGISLAQAEPIKHRMRARELGVAPGIFQPGPLNAITDVGEVRVGHTTVVKGSDVRTGVTAVVPHPGNVFQKKVSAAVFVGNAFGKLAGSTQVQELGNIETPIILTNTLDVGCAVETVVEWTLSQPGNEHVQSVNALVGETNDGYLNDIRGQHVTSKDVIHAIETASGDKVREGAIGAGTGTVNFGWKGGIGTSSRHLPHRFGGYSIGVLVQTNYGGLLSVIGVPIGLKLGHNPFAKSENNASESSKPDKRGGSCMIVLATDAPLRSRNLQRLAARAIFGLGRTGSSYTNGSGDYAIAFSTSPEERVRYGAHSPANHRNLPNFAMTPLFQAALETSQEAVYNALCMATTTTGNGRTVKALPLNDVRRLLRKYGRTVSDSSATSGD